MPRTPQRLLPAAALLLATSLAAGCGWFDDPSPDEARLIVQGDAGATVRIVVSREFVAAVDEVGVTQVEIFRSDTFHVAPPFDRTFSIRQEQLFFAEASPLESGSSLRMRVLLDGAERFNDGGALDAEAVLRFVFIFNKLVTSNIEVL